MFHRLRKMFNIWGGGKLDYEGAENAGVLAQDAVVAAGGRPPTGVAQRLETLFSLKIINKKEEL